MVVLTPYKAQIDLVRQALGRKLENSHQATREGGSDRAGQEVTVCTVDGFQGREAEVVVMSCVRTQRGGRIGFLSDLRRQVLA